MTLFDRIAKLSEADTAVSTTRGDLLSRAAKASLGVALVLAGLSRAEKAGAQPDPVVGCCFLAYTTECTGCTGHGYDCNAPCQRWAWYCVDANHRVWICGECYSAQGCPTGCSCGRVALRTDNTPVLLGPGGR